MIKAYNRLQASPGDHRQFYRNLNKTAVDDYKQYVLHVDSRFTSFPATETQSRITTNHQKGRLKKLIQDITPGI